MPLTHNSKTAENEPAWGDVDKTKLPREAHADMGNPEDKTSWRYPHHWVKNGELGDDGYGNEVYVSGTMYLHEGGLDTAWAYAQGARTGEKASREVREHLRRHRKALDKDDEDENGALPQSLYSGMHGPWAITRAGMDNVIAMAERAEAKQGLMTQEGRQPQNTSLTQIRGDVAVISVIGPMFHYENILTMVFGLPATETVAQEYRKALDNSEVNSIVLWIDSPGGQLGGISELAQQIAKGKQKKKTVAYVGDFGASAAYWIASAASEIVAVDTAELGSIGVVLGLRRSPSDSIEIVGSQSPKKRPDPDTDEGRRQLQEQVDALTGVFIDAVSEYRNLGQPQVMSLQGDVVIAAQAIKAGLADRIGSLEGVIKELTTERETGASIMSDMTAEGIKKDYPEVAQALAEEGKQQAKQDQQEHDLAVMEAILGTEAKDQVKDLLESGMTVEQIQHAQKVFGQENSGGGDGKDGPSRQEILDETRKAHGEGVKPGSDETPKSSLSDEAKRRAKETEGEE